MLKVSSMSCVHCVDTCTFFQEACPPSVLSKPLYCFTCPQYLIIISFHPVTCTRSTRVTESVLATYICANTTHFFYVTCPVQNVVFTATLSCASRPASSSGMLQEVNNILCPSQDYTLSIL
ncbi:hypothetical protein BsWGS_05410 [Bradybaena similaris]